MDEYPFIQRILDLSCDHANVGPWLVFADWLEERGDPRGRLVRSLAELPPELWFKRMDLLRAMFVKEDRFAVSRCEDEFCIHSITGNHFNVRIDNTGMVLDRRSVEYLAESFKRRPTQREDDCDAEMDQCSFWCEYDPDIDIWQICACYGFGIVRLRISGYDARTLVPMLEDALRRRSSRRTSRSIS